jgi:CRP/FNR family transcriptional regulator, dissimilatory nitrate respiration regulator
LLGLDESRLVERQLAAGEVLFRQGDRADNMFLVISGRVRLERHARNGALVPQHVAGPGEFFAEASLFSDTYHCDALALRLSRVRIYPHREVLAKLKQDPASAEGLLAMLSRQLQASRHRAELRAVRSARERVLLYLEYRADSQREVAVEGELQDLAADLALTREAFYRTLATLEREGVIARTETRLKLL